VATDAFTPIASALGTRADMAGVEELELILRPKMLANHLLHVGPARDKVVGTAVDAGCGETVASSGGIGAGCFWCVFLDLLDYKLMKAATAEMKRQ
jgi:hypothetical protein